MGPPPAGYVPPIPSPNSHSNAPPPPGGHGYAPGGAWVNNPGGAFYTAPAAAPHMPPTTPQYGPQFGGQQQQYQYSQCNGRKKALCIGINYVGMEGELRGCINDAKNMKQFLIRRFGFKPENIVMLLDDATHPRQMPTRQNILEAMQWLVKDARPNDSLWFHYSGHGGQTKDMDGDEEDGHDEVIYPYDHDYAGHIVDDEMHDIMVRPLPIGCRLTAIFDSCHSGSVMDLPYIYSTEGKIKEPNQALEAGKGAMQAFSAYKQGDVGGVLKAGMGIFKVATGGQAKATKKARELKGSQADVIQWSGCKDSQTSADAFEAGRATGAMSFAFITSMGAPDSITLIFDT
ncbi:Ca(2+)-dependent cysteine protease [Serendipita sp. 399]|nr:Ca(2+)-dependent cysteine protease [Serendipita sp. 399]